MQAFSYEENKIKLHDVGHMTKMAAKPTYVMNLSKYIYSPRPSGLGEIDGLHGTSTQSCILT